MMRPSDPLASLQPLSPTMTAPLFAPLLDELLALLRGLPAEAWTRPTLARAWQVRDIAAHLLDGDLRRLSAARDGHALSTRPVTGYADVFALIQELNAGGVQFGQRLSPRLLIDLLAVTGRWVADYFAALPPHGDAVFAVDWAGEARSEHWMDIGRDYTERWHHQMQIRDAVGAAPLYQDRWLRPLLELSVRALPRAYRQTMASAGTSVLLEVEASPSLAWSLVRQADQDRPTGGHDAWVVLRGTAASPAVRLRADPDTAWKLLYNALSPDQARSRVNVEGDARLAEPLLSARSVMV